MATTKCPNCNGTGRDGDFDCMTTGCNGGYITVSDDW